MNTASLSYVTYGFKFIVYFKKLGSISHCDYGTGIYEKSITQ
jgi:hypothetical protein